MLPEAISRGDESPETANSSTRMPLATTPRETSTTWMEIPGIGPRARLLIHDESNCVLPMGALTSVKNVPDLPSVHNSQA